MSFLPRRALRYTLVPLIAASAIVAFSGWRQSPAHASPQISSGTESKSLGFDHRVKGSIRPGQTLVWATPPLKAWALYSVDISLDHPASLTTPDELIPRRIASPITFNVVKKDII